MGLLVRFFEQRTHPSANTDWGRIFGAGMSSAAGVEVTTEGSLAFSAVWSCVRVISESIASLPLITYRRLADGKARATDHILYRTLKEQANTEQTSFEWRELMMAHVCLWGNAYSEIEWSNGGRPLAVWPLRPDRMSVARKDGELVYTYRLPSGQFKDFAAWQIHHIRGLSGDGIVGYSPIAMARQAIGLGLGTEEFGARFFGNGARPGMVLKHPGKLSETAYKRLQMSWNKDHEGLSQSHRLKILEEGMDATAIGVPPEEAQFLQTRNFQAHEIARFYRMPPHKIGLLENATFSNIEHQAIEFVVDTLRPWLVRHEQALARDLFATPAERNAFFVEYLVDGLLRGDIKSRYDAYAIGRNWGWLSANDVRGMENMNPIKGGDTYLSPLNMVDAAGSTGSPTVKRGLSRVYEDGVRRLMRREAADVRRAVDKHLRKSGAEAFRTWADEFYRELAPVMREQLLPAVATQLEQAGKDPAVAEKWLGGFVAEYVVQSRNLLGDCLRSDAPATAAEELLIDVEYGRWVTLSRQLGEEVEALCN